MAKYFSRFPQTYYQQLNDNSLEVVTKLTAGFSIEPSFKTNSSVYYPYTVKDGETPEMLSNKFYGSPERHWLILSMNDIVDPFYDWPLDGESLLKYIEDKYVSNASSNQTGLQWAKYNTYAYFRNEKLTYNETKKSIQKIKIDANQYSSLASSTIKSLVLSDGTRVVSSITKSTISYYDYEVQENEKKRTIKILRPEVAASLDEEMKNVFNARI